MPLDLTSNLVELTLDICNIESVSGNEQTLADAIEAALTGLPHLEIIRNGNALVAKTNLGRAQRVVIAGHIDTVPVNNNLPIRWSEDEGAEWLWRLSTKHGSNGVLGDVGIHRLGARFGVRLPCQRQHLGEISRIGGADRGHFRVVEQIHVAVGQTGAALENLENIGIRIFVVLSDKAAEERTDAIARVLGDKLKHSVIDRGELTIQVDAANYLEACRQLRDADGCKAEQHDHRINDDPGSKRDGRQGR